MTTTALPTTVRYEGEDIDPATIHDASGLPRPLVVKAFPEGSRILYSIVNGYGPPKVGILKSHTPHIVEYLGGYGTERKRNIRPTESGRHYLRKAETWANRSVGFLVVDEATGEEEVAKRIHGTPEAGRAAARRAATYKRKAAEERALRDIAAAVRKGAMEAVLVQALGADHEALRGYHAGVHTPSHHLTPVVSLDAVEALVEALVPGLLDAAKDAVLVAIEEGTLPEGEA